MTLTMKRKNVILLSTLLLIFIGLTFLCIKRWNIWFGNPPEPPYNAQEKISRVLLTMGEDEKSRYVTWQYDSIIHPSYIDYYAEGENDTLTTAADASIYRSRSGVTAYYSALLDHLMEGRDYHYRIRARKAASSQDCLLEDTTSWFSFNYPRSYEYQPPYSFLYFGDVQDEMDGGFEKLLSSAMNENKDARFLLFGEDFIERPMDQFWGLAINSLDTFATHYPILSVTGNHDYLKGVTRKLEQRFPLIFKYFDKPMKLHHDNAVYTFVMGNARFFFLDSNKDFYKFFEQREWLKEELIKSNEQWKIVVLHHPLLSVRGAFNNLSPKTFFNDLVTKFGVDLVLQGHEHVYARFNVATDNKGKFDEPLRLVSYASKKDYPMAFHGNVSKWGTADRYYQRFTIGKDTLKMTTYNSEQKIYDEIYIVKNANGKRLIDKGVEIPQKICVSDWFKRNQKEKKVKAFQKNIDDWISNHPETDLVSEDNK